jgi:hypothetical protein
LNCLKMNYFYIFQVRWWPFMFILELTNRVVHYFIDSLCPLGYFKLSESNNIFLSIIQVFKVVPQWIIFIFSKWDILPLMEYLKCFLCNKLPTGKKNLSYCIILFCTSITVFICDGCNEYLALVNTHSLRCQYTFHKKLSKSQVCNKITT